MRVREGASTQPRAAIGWSAALTAWVLALTACAPSAGPEPETPPATSVTAAAVEHLAATPCPDEAIALSGLPSAEGLLCGSLTVPRDHDDPDGETAELMVLLTDEDAPRGVLLLLGGGPGGSASWLVPLVRLLMPEVAAQYQIVAMDQRGTGSTAVDCPLVQEQTGSSDILPPSGDALAACAPVVADWGGPLATEASIADFEVLRAALGAPVWTLNGVSYGTFVAQEYAVAHPDAVRALVLDSVVPGTGVDPFLLSSFAAVPGVLADVCELAGCDTDGAADIAAVIEAGYPGLPLFNAIVAMSASGATFPGLHDALATARDGDTAALDELVATMQASAAAPLAMFSSGAHVATLCADTPMPWGSDVTDSAARTAALDAALAELTPEQTWPFPTSVAGELATVQACLQWADAGPAEAPGGELPDIPVLLLTGELDLSTPFANAAQIVPDVPQPTVISIPGVGHSAQLTAAGAGAVSDFLLSID